LQEFFSDGDIIRSPSLADEIIKGLTIQASESVDNNFVIDVTDQLFDDGEMGLDLIAINMQRGREHGLPGYVRYREICGVGRATKFEDLQSNIPADVSYFSSLQNKILGVQSRSLWNV
jgi:peroxidase